MLLKSLWCEKGCLQPLLDYMASWHQKNRVTGHSFLPTLHIWQMLENPYHTLSRENSLFQSSAGGPEPGVPPSLLYHAPCPAPPSQLHPGNAPTCFGDFQLRLKLHLQGFAHCLEESCWSLEFVHLSPAPTKLCL